MACRPADASLFISAITEAELRHGVALLPPGKRRSILAAAIENTLGKDFTGRIFPLDSPAASAFAEIAVTGRQADRPTARGGCALSKGAIKLGQSMNNGWGN